MFKSLGNAVTKAVEGNRWTKFSNPSAGRGKTVFPTGSKDQENLGVRWDYDGETNIGGDTYHKFQMQPNAGKIPAGIKDWRERNGGTHAVMASAYVKKDGTKEDVREALSAAAEKASS